MISAVALAGVVGCGSGSAVSNTPAVTSATPADAATTEASPSAADLTKTFGSTFTWDDGLAITVSAPQPLPPSEILTAISPDWSSFVVMDVTVTNGTSAPVPALDLRLQATTGSRQAEAAFDSSQGIELPTVDVLPGADLTWKAAFGVEEGQPFVVSVDYGFGNATGYYK